MDALGPSVPKSFAFDGKRGDSEFMLAAEVCRYLGKPAEWITKTYPALFHRQATFDERAWMVKKVNSSSADIISAQTVLVTLIRASSALKLIEGEDEEFKDSPLPDFEPEDVPTLPRRDGEAPRKRVRLNAVPSLEERVSDDGITSSGIALPSNLRSVRPIARRPWNPFGSLFRTVGFGESREKLVKCSEVEEVLVPVRLELEADGYKLRDAFTWNLNDPIMLKELFAEQLCEELELPMASFAGQIVESINAQLEEYAAMSAVAPALAAQDAERRINLKLDVHVGGMTLTDQFEWDIVETARNIPEEFAQRLCAEVGLGGEYMTSIAHSIREQTFWSFKALVNNNTVGGEQSAEVMLPPLRASADVDDWGPGLEVLTDAERERVQQARDRHERRMRRSTRDDKKGRRSIKSTGLTGVVTPAPIVTPTLYVQTSARANVTACGHLLDEIDVEPNEDWPQVMATAKRSRALVSVIGEGEEEDSEDLSNIAENWTCELCGCKRRDTTMVYRGPSGPSTLCRKCGLKWRNS